MSGTPTLVFCAGTVKSGTSWLHAYLRDHPEAYFRSVKETRFFSAMEGGWLKLRLRKLDEEIATLQAALDTGKAVSIPFMQRQIDDRKALRRALTTRADKIGAFVAYLTAAAGDRKVAGEMTPEFGMLPANWIKKINALAADVRWILLLRDPVSRLWSHVRMIVRDTRPAPASFEAACVEELDKILAGNKPEVAARGDYATIHGRLVANVAPEKRLVMVYERLMSGAGIARVTDFLGLAPHPARTERIAYPGVALDLPEPLRLRAREWLRPQYEYMARAIGLPPEWEAFPEFRSEVA